MPRKRFLDKGIEFDVPAKGRAIQEGETYTAAIYNEEYPREIIEATATINDQGYLLFTFGSDDTLLLRPGDAVVEVYDNNKKLMAHRDAYAIIRNTSISNK